MPKAFDLTATSALLTGRAATGPALATSRAYDPVIDPTNFATKTDNPFFSLPVGKKMIFENITEDVAENAK